MKKTILVVLMAVMIATPCLAQEVETDGIFSIEGTWWEGEDMALFYSHPGLEIGFFEGDAYGNNAYQFNFAFYFDTPLFSSFFLSAYDHGGYYVTGVLFPLIGFGFGVERIYPNRPFPVLFRMTNGDWTPLGVD